MENFTGSCLPPHHMQNGSARQSSPAAPAADIHFKIYLIHCTIFTIFTQFCQI
jgi:hypothetical protein